MPNAPYSNRWLQYDEKNFAMKNRLISILSLITITITFSCCKSSMRMNTEYKNCINNQVINNFSYSSENYNDNLKFPNKDFNIFDSLKKYEKFLLKEKHLKGTHKKGYSDFIESIEQIDKPKEILDEIYYGNPFLEHLMKGNNGNLTHSFHRCTRILYEKNGEEFRSDNYIIESDLIIANGGIPSINILKKLSNQIDYSDKIQRLQLSYYILDNLDYRNDSIQRIK